jgi:hypothetical protein
MDGRLDEWINKLTEGHQGKERMRGWELWFTPVIPATHEVESRRISVCG